MSPYKIYIKSYTGKRVRLPIVPKELPTVTRSADVTDFTSIKNGHYTIIGQRQVPTLSVEHLLPGKELSFAVSSTTGAEIVKILEEAMKKEIPIKYIIAMKGGGYYVNNWFAVTSYSKRVDKKNDWIINMDLTKWRKYAGWQS